jgi:tetratricopeptide (TPR) repeat protein
LRRGGLPRAFLLLALSASALQGCAELSPYFRTTPPATPPAAVPPAAVPPAAVPPAAVPPAVAPAPAAPPAAKPPAIALEDKLFAEGMQALQEGGHEQALELFSAAWQEKPGHAGVAREFDGALLALKKNGDAAYNQQKWEDAGKRWMGTLRFITHPAANPRSYPFTRNEVRAKVDALTVSLAEKALKEYQRGEIPAAIADWKTILSYDPGNEEAARSLNTASKQLETLKKMPPGK